MKLLFDENLPPSLVRRLNDLFPGSAHVHELGLGRTEDKKVWDHAGGHGFAVVSKDRDHYDISLLHGHPPKVIWIRIGNCTVADLESVLRRAEPSLRQFFADSSESAFIIQ